MKWCLLLRVRAQPGSLRLQWVHGSWICLGISPGAALSERWGHARALACASISLQEERRALQAKLPQKAPYHQKLTSSNCAEAS